jgi:serine/threonine-protein kinase HipA
MSEVEEINVLKLTLHGKLVGYLAGFRNGRNVLIFDNEFKNDSGRPTLSLITSPRFSGANVTMAKPLVCNQKLHPILSNLLPEGAMREIISQELKVHIDNEFYIMSYLGKDLPGALVVEPMEPENVPVLDLAYDGKVKAVKFDTRKNANKFSLAGVQIKFSMKEKDGRYNMPKADILGDWIIKTPSTKHNDVPLNEYTAMRLASLAGINIPEIKLVEMNKLDNLPHIKLPNEKLAFAIRRFDRDSNIRIHMEDFAQVLVKYPHEKYNSASYEQIGKIIYNYSGNGLTDIQQFARRLLVNILLANGDAHLKNWSFIYSDQITPRLSQAYDIVTTSVYIKDEHQYALNLGKTKDWHTVSYANFEAWANKVGVPWRAIKPHLDDTMNKARSLWPNELKNLPMNEKHKKFLKDHWGNLQDDFKIID